ncbi:MAG: divalent metal cation transporter [Neisseria sp.]|nr:divalent metal cation transporter [Neisseria sp.]
MYAAQIDWKARLKAMGPGLLMASAAVGGSHLVASTQAGALYGWQLAVVIVLVNLLKYPFFRFSVNYTVSSGKSLVEGYSERSRAYVWVFMLLSIPSATISTGAVALLSAVILKNVLPVDISVPVLTVGLMIATLVIVLGGHFKLLDKVTKWIMISLTLSTVIAVAIAAGKGSHMQPEFIETSPWTWASLSFIVALMGWMPAPMEVSAANSMWILAKQREGKNSLKDALFDFDVGYGVSLVLALIFLALGALVQYGNGQELKLQGGAYIGQLISMYAEVMGDWTRLLVAFIAFACMFGTLLTVADLYGRLLAEAQRLLTKSEYSRKTMAFWTVWSVASGLVLILWFKSALGEMLRFAMISAFLTAPVYAWLNYSLVRRSGIKINGVMRVLAALGLVYLVGFALIFVAQQLGWL